MLYLSTIVQIEEALIAYVFKSILKILHSYL